MKKRRIILALAMLAGATGASANDQVVKQKIAEMMYQRMFCFQKLTPAENEWVRIEAERLTGTNDLITTSAYVGTLVAPLYREAGNKGCQDG